MEKDISTEKRNRVSLRVNQNKDENIGQVMLTLT